MRERVRHALPAVIALVLFVVALAVLRTEVRTVSWHDLTGDIRGTPVRQLGWAVLLTALNYATLTGYDLLAFAYIRKRLARGLDPSRAKVDRTYS